MDDGGKALSPILVWRYHGPPLRVAQLHQFVQRRSRNVRAARCQRLLRRFPRSPVVVVAFVIIKDDQTSDARDRACQQHGHAQVRNAGRRGDRFDELEHALSISNPSLAWIGTLTAWAWMQAVSRALKSMPAGAHDAHAFVGAHSDSACVCQADRSTERCEIRRTRRC